MTPTTWAFRPWVDVVAKANRKIAATAIRNKAVPVRHHVPPGLCGGAGRPVRWACSLVPPVRLPLGAASVILASEQVTGRRCHGVHHLWPGPWPGPARARKNSGTSLQPQHRGYSCRGPEQCFKRTPRRSRRIGVVESAHCRSRFPAHRSSQVESADLQLPSLLRARPRIGPQFPFPHTPPEPLAPSGLLIRGRCEWRTGHRSDGAVRRLRRC